MKNIAKIIKTGLVVLLLTPAGCSKPQPPAVPDETTLQGTWKGHESGVNVPGSPSLVLTGNNLEFRGADTNEWYKGTFALQEDKTPKQLTAVITECPFPAYVGKTVHGIYRLDGGTLTLAANEPGAPAIPAAFNSPGARQFVFQMDKP
jgi:uncharacterized protein (TIGR03067 family)